MGIDVTPALRQAACLFALAEHLTRNPHLSEVIVHLDKLQLSKRSAAALLDWADSLTAPTASVQGIKGQAFAYVTGSLPSGVVTVWTTVPGLLDVLGLDDEARSTPLDLDVFRTFAATAVES